MDKRSEILQKLIKDTGLSKKAFAEKIGLPPTTLRSMLERGIGKASVDNVIKVCKALGITTEDLERMANGGKTIDEQETYNPLEEINEIMEDLKIKAFGFQDIEKWKNLSPEDVEDIKKHVEWVVHKAQQREDKE